MHDMKVVSYFRLRELRWSIAESDLDELRHRFPGVTFTSVEEDDALAGELADATVFLGWDFPPHLFDHAPRLRWLHSASAGIEANLFPALVDSNVILTNSAGLHSVSIPEHVLGLMLLLARNFHEAQRLQHDHTWDRTRVIMFAGGVRELAGSHLAVLGAGAIGRAVARLGNALDMRVQVMRRRPSHPVPGTERVVGPEGLLELCGWADFVVVATPLTEHTRHLINRTALRAMKSGTYLINIARGEVVDDEALIDALRNQAIAGAGLDVFRDEPLPPASPYWSLPNAIVTPHVSGYTPAYFAKMLALFADNVERFVRGSPLRNVVNKHVGYVEA